MSNEAFPKGVTVAFIPYRVAGDGAIEIFLQLSDQTHPTAHRRGTYGTFGGGVEKGESFLDAVVREATEELQITDSHGQLIKLEHDNFIALLDKNGQPFEFEVKTWKGFDVVHVHCSPIGNLFIVGKDKMAKNVKILEGAGGRFFSLDDLKASPLVNTTFRKHLVQAYEAIRANHELQANR